MDHLDLTTNVPFHSSVWIGTGKKFSHSLPKEVLEELQGVLEVPQIIRTSLPPPSTLVGEFIQWSPPFQSGSLSFHANTEWFSKDIPHTDPNSILTRSIPPRAVLRDLNRAIGQVWLDGYHSVVDPRFEDGMERFPLWVLSLWTEVQELIESQNDWKRSIQWLDSLTHPMEIITQVKDMVLGLSWNQPLRLPGATSMDLTGFLGSLWLSDTQIDMMIGVLQERMKVKEYVEGTIIEPVALSQELVLVARGMKEPNSKYLSRLAGRIRRTDTKSLWFPIHVNGCHWIVGQVDFERHTFAFGELFEHMTNDTN